MGIEDRDIVAHVRGYAELRAALRRRRADLRLTVADLDAISGVQPGYSTKLENGIKNFGPQSLECILGALGLEIVLVRASGSLEQEVPAAWEQSAAAAKKFRKISAQKGGRRRWGESLPHERANHMRKLALKLGKMRRRKAQARVKRSRAPVEAENPGSVSGGDFGDGSD